MKTVRVVIATCAVLAATSSVAKADLVEIAATNAGSFVALGAQGFGNAPRLLTEQTNTFESGGVTPVNVVNGDAISGADKSTTPLLSSSALGWTSGAQVGIGFNAGQSGQTGITLDSLVLTIYGPDKTTVEGTFSLASPINYSAADLSLQQGNGNAVFDFKLTASEQTTFNNILAMSGSSGFYVGLAASLGCNTTPSATCQVTNDGPDSFIGFQQSTATPVPDGGATIILLGGALLAVESLRRRLRA